MTDLRRSRLLARYRSWADELTFEAVTALPPGESEKERPTPLKSILSTLCLSQRSFTVTTGEHP